MDAEELDRLAERTQRGDRAAFRQVVLLLQGDLRLYLAAFEVSLGLVEEVVQATFVTAFLKIALYEPRRAFRAWLRTIARNHLLKELRDQKRLASVKGDVLAEALADAGLGDFDRADEIEAQSKRLRLCIEKLTPASQELIALRYDKRESTSSLAERFQRTETSVRVTLCRIRKVLRQCLATGDASA